MYLRRPGGQSQFSAPLAAQSAECGQIAELVTFVEANLEQDRSVTALARRAHMSVRNFAHVFRRETGKTPAAYVERARLDAARRRLELAQASVKEIATQSGFGSVEALHRTRCSSFTAPRTNHRPPRAAPAQWKRARRRRPPAPEAEPSSP